MSKQKPWWQYLNELQPQKQTASVGTLICSKCRRYPAKNGRTCQRCRNNREVKAREAEARGDCQKCFTRPAAPGYKSCVECRASVARYRAKQKEAAR